MENFHDILKSKTVLIADDDPSTLKWLDRVLKLYFKKVYKTSDAIEALEIFNEHKTDIIISDIQMPGVNGLTFLNKVSSTSANTLKVVMTAFNNENYLNKAVKSGVDFYFKKPVDIDELLFSLSSNLSKNSLQKDIDLGKGFCYDENLKSIYNNSHTIKLTKKEALLLELLIKNRYGVVSMEHIEETIYKEPATSDAIRMVVVGLRKKLYPDAIENLKGFGYRLNLK